MSLKKLISLFSVAIILSCSPKQESILLENPMFATEPVENAGLDRYWISNEKTCDYCYS